MGKKIVLTRFGICEQCARRDKCCSASKNATSCGQLKDRCRFKTDAEVKRKINEIHHSEIEAFFSKLKYTDRSQVSVSSEMSVSYVPKSDDVRIANSRSGFVGVVSCEQYDLVRYCENCGKKVCTVNAERRLCDECHDEICEYLGVNYATVPRPKLKTR